MESSKEMKRIFNNMVLKVGTVHQCLSLKHLPESFNNIFKAGKKLMRIATLSFHAEPNAGMYTWLWMDSGQVAMSTFRGG